MSKKGDRRAERARRARQEKAARREHEPKEPGSMAAAKPVKLKNWPMVAIFLGLMTIVGGIPAVYELLRPKVQVSKTDSLDPSDALETRFTITSESFFQMEDVKMLCDIGRVETIPPRNQGVSSILMDDQEVDRLGTIPPNGSATAPCILKKIVRPDVAIKFGVFVKSCG